MAGNRSSFLFRLFHRLTKEEEILQLEKRYLKKYLRHYQLYLDHMTLPEMRLAKRCLEDSLGSSTESSSSPAPIPRCTSTPTSKANPKTARATSKHVSFHRTLVQYTPVALDDDGWSSDSSEEEISTLFDSFLFGEDSGPTYVSFEQPEP